DALRRSEAARGDRPRDPHGPEGPCAGRLDVGSGHGDGADHPAGAGAGDQGPDVVRDRAPPTHSEGRRPDPGAGTGRDRAAGHPRRARGSAGALPDDLPTPAPRPGGRAGGRRDRGGRAVIRGGGGGGFRNIALGGGGPGMGAGGGGGMTRASLATSEED